MQKVGIKEFRDNATKLLAAGESLLIERHGHPVGYFIPVKKKDESDIAKAMLRLEKAIELALDESSLSQEELADLFIIKREHATGS